MISYLCYIVKVSVNSYNNLQSNKFYSSFREVLKLKATNHTIFSD